jgi:germacradienol/geosmin synthase
MQPFELPDFYMPRLARLNPGQARARAHTKEWAGQIGVLDPDDQGRPSVWDEGMLDSMDFAIWTSYAYPDAPGPQLDVVTDWAMLGTFFDDLFVERFKRTRDREGALKYIARIAQFMPVDLTVSRPEATDAVERGLADLWPRTAQGMSPEWRQRCVKSAEGFIEEAVAELANMSADRAPNPIEFVEARRGSSGFAMPINLVEFALGAEAPRAMLGTRAMRVLVSAILDSANLRNDIFSYQRETEVEGELGNGMLVTERFFGLPPQEAANAVNELITSRMHQFEKTAATEVPILLEESGADPAERASVLRYLGGLQDWEAGVHEWHTRSSRYMNTATGGADAAPDGPGRGLSTGGGGLGLASAAPVTSRNVAAGMDALSHGPFSVPPFSMPYPARLNAHVDGTRRHARAWAGEMGMLDGLPGWWGAEAWTERRFDSMDIGLLAGLAHPDADHARLDLAADWHVWRLFFDDLFVEAFKRTRDLAGAKAFMARLAEFLPDDLGAMPVPTNPVERGLADLWARTVPALPPGGQAQMACDLVELFESWLWELSNLAGGRLPDPVDYVEMRRRTSGARLAIDLVAMTLGAAFPPEVRSLRLVADLLDAFADIGALRNDVLSYRKETEREGEFNNAVVIVHQFVGGDLQSSVDLVALLLEARLDQFERTSSTELPALLDERELDGAARHAALALVAGLEAWMAGDLKWAVQTGRYRQPEGKQRAPRRAAIPTISGRATAPWPALGRDVPAPSTSIPTTREFSVL